MDYFKFGRQVEMTKNSWRPLGWKQPLAQADCDAKKGEVVQCHLLSEGEIAIYEYGADDMLEALRREGVTARGNDGDNRVWGIEVFIPDDTETSDAPPR
jgi:hypothetical protein